MQTHIQQPSTDQMQDKELMRLLGLGGSTASSIIRLASSKKDLKELLPVLNSACSGLSFCQVFDPRAIIDEAHLQLAYLNAKAAFEEDRNMSKSMQIEMLLFCRDDQADKRGHKDRWRKVKQKDAALLQR
jgi:Kinase binding protein CGI-121.